MQHSLPWANSLALPVRHDTDLVFSVKSQLWVLHGFCLTSKQTHMSLTKEIYTVALRQENSKDDIPLSCDLWQRQGVFGLLVIQSRAR